MSRGTDDDEMWEISDEGDFASVTSIPMDEKPIGGDEEDLFFGSSSFNRSIKEDDEGLGTDDSFGWANGPPDTSFSINVLESTPSPRKGIRPGVTMLEKKYKPRDSGVVMSEDEDGSGSVIPRSMGMGFGRSGSVRDLPMPRASTSVSTVASSDQDQEFFTPVFPTMHSGWPSLPGVVTASDSEGTLPLSSMPVDSEVDAFIVRTLLHAQDADTQPKRPPGTPQKRLRTVSGFGFGQRPWQSAVTNKVGFDFGDEDGTGTKENETKKGKPRKSLPAAFPMLDASKKSKKNLVEPISDEEDASPCDRREKYESLGLGRPSVGKAGKTGWLLRRSSSSGISNASATSGSGEGSWPGTPTATNDGTGE